MRRWQRTPPAGGPAGTGSGSAGLPQGAPAAETAAPVGNVDARRRGHPAPRAAAGGCAGAVRADPRAINPWVFLGFLVEVFQGLSERVGLGSGLKIVSGGRLRLQQQCASLT